VQYGDSVGNRAPGRCACARVAVPGVRSSPAGGYPLAATDWRWISRNRAL
jgi:hypothetical protein